MALNNCSIFRYGGQCVWQARLFEHFFRGPYNVHFSEITIYSDIP